MDDELRELRRLADEGDILARGKLRRELDRRRLCRCCAGEGRVRFVVVDPEKRAATLHNLTAPITEMRRDVILHAVDLRPRAKHLGWIRRFHFQEGGECGECGGTGSALLCRFCRGTGSLTTTSYDLVTLQGLHPEPPRRHRSECGACLGSGLAGDPIGPRPF